MEDDLVDHQEAACHVKEEVLACCAQGDAHAGHWKEDGGIAGAG